MFDTYKIKKNILEVGKKIYDKGLTSGKSGNISLRQNGQIFITGTGVCLGDMTEEEIVILDEQGNIVDNSSIKPSSESIMHVEIYKLRPEIDSIIHAHPPFTTSLAASGINSFPAILAEPVVLLGDISLVKYETPSSIELAKEVASHFTKSDAVLMANHGATVCGNDLKETFYKLETLEFYSQVYLFSGLLGKRSELSEENIQALMKLKH